MKKDKEMLHLRKEMKEKELACCELVSLFHFISF